MSGEQTYRLLSPVKTRPGTPRKMTLAIRLAGEGPHIALVEATAREQSTCVSRGCRTRAHMGFLVERREEDGGGLALVFACEKHEPKKRHLAAGIWTP